MSEFVEILQGASIIFLGVAIILLSQRVSVLEKKS